MGREFEVSEGNALKATIDHDQRRNDPAPDIEDLTERMLMSLVFDVGMLSKNVERVRVQVHTLARERGIATDVPDGD